LNILGRRRQTNGAALRRLAGAQRSPIDIGETVKARLPPLRIPWGSRAESIVNNGHSIQVNFAEGSALTVGNKRYTLQQFHFHHPSEHLIGGKAW
jgi:carbonic anhydrase